MMKYPSKFFIELTPICNLACVLCDNPFITRSKGFMDLEKFQSLVRETDSSVSYYNFGVTAEPLLHPKVIEFIRYAKVYHKKTSMTTNGILLEKFSRQIIESGLDEIVISLDGMSKESYETYRKSKVVGENNFEKVKKGIESLCFQKRITSYKTPIVVISFMVTKYNEHEIEKAKEWCREIGVNKLLLKAMHFAWRKDGSVSKSDWEPDNKTFVRYYDYKKLGVCEWVDNATVIYWNGTLSSCCYDLIGNTNFENVFEKGFYNVWDSEQRKKIKPLMASRDLEMCKDCSANLPVGKIITFEKNPFNFLLNK